MSSCDRASSFIKRDDNLLLTAPPASQPFGFARSRVTCINSAVYGDPALDWTANDGYALSFCPVISSTPTATSTTKCSRGKWLGRQKEASKTLQAMNSIAPLMYLFPDRQIGLIVQ